MIEETVVPESCHDGVPTATLEVELDGGRDAWRFDPVESPDPTSRIAERHLANAHTERHAGSFGPQVPDAPHAPEEQIVVPGFAGLAVLDHLSKSQGVVVERNTMRKTGAIVQAGTSTEIAVRINTARRMLMRRVSTHNIDDAKRVHRVFEQSDLNIALWRSRCRDVFAT